MTETLPPLPDAGIVTVLVANGTLFSIILGAFLFLRPLLPRLYNHRCFVKGENCNSSHSVFSLSWLRKTISANDPEILDSCGLDNVVYLKFSRLVIKLTAIVCFVCLVICLPVNMTGHQAFIMGTPFEMTPYVSTTVGHLELGDNRLWAHAMASLALSILIYYIVYRFCVEIAEYIRTHGGKYGCSVELQSLVLKGFPVDPKSVQGTEELIRRWVSSSFPDCSVALVRVALGVPRKLTALIKQREEIQKKLDHALGVLEKTRHRPTVREPWYSVHRVDSISHYEQRIERLDSKIQKNKEKIRPVVRGGLGGMAGELDRLGIEVLELPNLNSPGASWDIGDNRRGLVRRISGCSLPSVSQFFLGQGIAFVVFRSPVDATKILKEHNTATLQISVPPRIGGPRGHPHVVPSALGSVQQQQQTLTQPLVSVSKIFSRSNTKNGGSSSSGGSGGAEISVELSTQSSIFIPPEMEHLPSHQIDEHSPIIEKKVAGTKFRVRWTRAPCEDDVLWSNFHIGPLFRALRRGIGYFVTFLLVFFWTIPVGALSRLDTFQGLPIVGPVIDYILRSAPFVRSLVVAYLPTLVLLLFNAYLTDLLRYLSKKEGFTSRTKLEKHSMSKYFAFIMLNTFILQSILQGGIQTVSAILRNYDYENLAVLAGSVFLQNISAFFVSFILSSALVSTPLSLLDLGTLIWGILASPFTATEEEKNTAWEPLPFPFIAAFPNLILIFSITLFFGLFAPLVPCAALLFFSLRHFVDRYRMIYVNIEHKPLRGMLVTRSVKYLFVGLAIHHFSCLGFFKIYNPQSAMWVFPLLLFLVDCAGYAATMSFFSRRLKHVSLEEAASLPSADLSHVSELYIPKELKKVYLSDQAQEL